MLGNRHIAGCHNQRDGGGDVETVLTIAAGAADVDCARRSGDPLHPGAHRQDGSGHFFSGFAAISQVNQSCSDDLVRHVAIEHSPEQRLSFSLVHAITRGVIPHSWRKLASIAWPCSVAMLSGWN